MVELPYQQALRYIGKSDYFVRHAPVVGPWISRTGHVVDILATPSNAGPQLVVQGFFYAVPKLIFLYTKPFLQAEEWYRFLSKKCGPKRKGKIAEFAKGLGFSEKTGMVSNKLGPLTTVVFDEIIEFGLKAEWWIMIGDYVTEFAYNWASLVYQWSFSAVEDEPHCLSTTGPGYEFAGTASQFRGWSVTDSGHGIGGDFITITVNAGVSASVTATLNSLPRPSDGQTANLNVWLVESETGIVTAQSGAMRTNADGTKSASASWLYDGRPRETFQSWSVYVTSDLDPCYVTGTFTAVGSNTGRKGLFFDP